jgi:amino acid adenylation domain-containing protein
MTKCIHELFETQAERMPDATAVAFEASSLTYRELNRRADELACQLRALGVGPGVLVALFLERSLDIVVAMLGVLKAGGAYVPLDPAYPRKRLAYMLEDAQPLILLTQGRLQSELPHHGSQVVVIDGDAPLARAPASRATLPSDLAYVIYTSGSTGEPKGVEIEHGAVVNMLASMRKRPGLGAADRMLAITTLTFDIAVLEIFLPLVCGACVVIAPSQTVWDGAALTSLISQSGVSVMQATPATLRMLLDAGWAGAPDMKILCGGEAYTTELASQVLARCGTLWNMYGPTETTVWSAVSKVEAGRPVVIGQPIANTRLYVLDRALQLVPVGVPGELCIGGAGLARGYLRRPRLTCERFVADPFAAAPGMRMYRTGDLVRRLSDGTIEFLGRLDHQVKIRGFRIEPGEVEGRLLEHAAIREAVVIAREDAPGDTRLVAYYVALDHESIDPGQLRSHLAATLPEYMVPAAYVRLDGFPLTPNGKLDRRALPSLDDAAYAREVYEAPQGETETVLAVIWTALLGVERISRNDNFFNLGGHSLLVVTLIERLRREGLQADVRAVFSAPTLAGMAAAVSLERADVEVPPNVITPGSTTITPELLPLISLSQAELEGIVSCVPGGAANIQDIYPLAPLQEGVLFHHLTGGEGDAYLMSSLLAFDSRARVDRFVTALQAVIDRHDIFRTAVMWEGLPQPAQVVWRRAPLPVEEVALEPAEGDAAEQLRGRFDPRRFRLDVRQAPLLRAFIAHDRVRERWLLLLLHHHLVMDQTTLDVLAGEVRAHVLGRTEELPAPIPFRNFVAQARRAVSAAEHEAFFRGMLSEVEEPTAPFGLLNVQGDGADIEEARAVLAPELARRLRERARVLGVSAASLFHLAWGLVVSRTSRRREAVFGTVLLGRMQGGAGVDRTPGMFINTLPIRVDIGEEGVEASVRRVHALLAELLRHEHTALALAQRCGAVPAPAPLFSALLNYRHRRPVDAQGSQAGEGGEWLGSVARSNYPVTLSVDDLGDGFVLTAQTYPAVGAERLCGFMRTALDGLAEALERTPDMAVRRVDMLGEVERHRVVAEWNATAADYPVATLPELFEAQVARTPDAVAVVYEDQRLTYGELNTRSNRLAHHLRGLGIKPDERVAICVERSVEMVVGVLAILKAGGAYVPLDPSAPSERLAHMLADSGPMAVLTDAASLGELRGRTGSLPVINLADGALLENEAASNPDRCDLQPHHLAYVLFTSGSTGTPKGVMIEHRSVVNLWHALRTEVYASCGVGCRISWNAPIFFDFSVEPLVQLLSGSTIVVLSTEIRSDPQQLARYLEHERIDVLDITTSQLALLLQEWETGHYAWHPTRVSVGGEAIDGAMWQSLAQRQETVFYNTYGPTETTVDATAALIAGETAEPHIGRPLANTQIYILDADGVPVPIGVTGELYIGGAQVARGYLNRPDLTAERFLADPFAGTPGARMYRTGDLGRWLPDGNIAFLGRNDFQVKIRGLRVELGEIETALCLHPDIAQAVVIAREDGARGTSLVGYVVAKPGHAVELTDLRAHLAGRLPDYMVPVALVRLDAFPLTPSDKLDRRALPSPDDGAYARETYEAPQGETETVLAAIWAELLGVARISRNDNFFELGGHSLMTIQVLSRLQQRMDVSLKVRDIFENSTLERLAEQIVLARLAQYRPEELATMLDLVTETN